MTSAPIMRGPHGVAIGLFLLVWLSCVWFGSNELNPNNATRMFAAVSLVENGDATIDEFETMTVDKARFGNHIYMDKTPGMTLMALPSVWALDRLTGDKASLYPYSIFDPRFDRFLRERQQLTVATSAAVLIALASVLLLDLATGLSGSPRAGLVAALGYAMGTPAWGWSTTLFGHAPVGALLLIATWAAWRGTSSVRDLARWRYPLMLGGSLGWAIVIELPALLPGAVIGLWAIWRTRAVAMPQRLRLVAQAAVPFVVALLPFALYNHLAFGDWFRVGYQGVVGFDGMQQGLFGLTYPHPDVLAKIIAGPERGLLFVAPVLVLAPIGLWLLIRARTTRDLGIMAAALVLVVLLYNASYFSWNGGYSTGPRHSMPAMGFLALGLAPLWAQWGRNGRRTLTVLLVISIFLNLAIASTEITAPEGAPFPIYDPILTRFFRLDIRTLPSDWWGWPAWRGLALYLTLAVPALWFLFRATSLSERSLGGTTELVA
jgi:hypothetical protein